MQPSTKPTPAPRRAFPPGVPCWIDLQPPDPLAAADFYANLFSWELEERLPPESGRHYLIARRDGLVAAAIGTPDVPGDGPPRWATYVAVDDADAAAARVRAAGGTTGAPVDVGPPGRSVPCTDPTGATFHLWEGRARKGVEVANAPGSWNWSDLVTPDPDAAVAFYGAVFGWVARSVDVGGQPSTMWCLPGYGDVLAEDDPDLRTRHAEQGVPEGFSDAVAWLLPRRAVDPTVPDGAARWLVTFSVDDPDDVAARAERRGGTVLVAPFDAGPVRMAVIQDPQGATCTVSRYQP